MDTDMLGYILFMDSQEGKRLPNNPFCSGDDQNGSGEEQNEDDD